MIYHWYKINPKIARELDEILNPNLWNIDKEPKLNPDSTND